MASLHTSYQAKHNVIPRHAYLHVDITLSVDTDFDPVKANIFERKDRIQQNRMNVWLRYVASSIM